MISREKETEKKKNERKRAKLVCWMENSKTQLNNILNETSIIN